MPLDKALGSGGFASRFFAPCWHIIKADIMRAMDLFYRGYMHGLTSIKNAIVTLRSKVEGAVDLKDFRPVSLIHGAIKIFDKVLANSLTGNSRSLWGFTRVHL